MIQSTWIKLSGNTSIDRNKHPPKGIRLQVHLIGKTCRLRLLYHPWAHTQHKQDRNKGLSQRVQSTRIKHIGTSCIDINTHPQKEIRLQVHLVGETCRLSLLYRPWAHTPHKQDRNKGLAQQVQSTRIKHGGTSSIDRMKHCQKGISLQVHLVSEKCRLSLCVPSASACDTNNKTTTKG